ncbi:hypothetical protein PENTCL1PPCAC_17495 [Pristionchus entomophagus]|uniref:ABC transporter domain-containing protein n=1 Tax=Pristionchus entomophagus TaxID=358040 RepID=A0AAV5TLS0_9BILA|nr:hypothetical protein PENTCL1PPCAC_17495 [Pristionchus entomophagus]
MNDDNRESQKMIGYCPQYNAVFPKLTVDEHLEFFTSLKGEDSWKETGDRIRTTVGMCNMGKAMPHQLSGGMKRKLCIAISLAGDSPIVLLDEPTAGMDPGARRDFERLLKEWKKDHTILLTTHYTDEAEMLADRIFIMARGKYSAVDHPNF